jgi:hypothetical protein
MRQKQLEIIAHIIDNLVFEGKVADQCEIRKIIADQFADRLANYNEKFNREKFMKAATNNPA